MCRLVFLLLSVVFLIGNIEGVQVGIPIIDRMIGPLLDGIGLRYPCFQCRDKCISYSWRCDGEVDCFSAEDEAECEYICPYSTHHRCSDTGYCIDNHHLCDGHYDCENGEDERNCGRPWIGKRGIPLYEDKSRSAKELVNLDKETEGNRLNYTPDDFMKIGSRVYNKSQAYNPDDFTKMGFRVYNNKSQGR